MQKNFHRFTNEVKMSLLRCFMVLKYTNTNIRVYDVLCKMSKLQFHQMYH